MKQIIITLAILISIMQISCEDNLETPSGDEYRVSEIIYEHDSIPVRKFAIEYEGDQVVQVNQYYLSDTTWKPNYQMNFIYQENKIIHEYYFVKGGEHEYYQKNIFTLEDGRLMEDMVYNGYENEWLLKGKWIFTYEDDHLASYREYRYIDNVWVERASAYFTFIDGYVAEHRYYDRYEGVDYLTDRDTFYWDDRRLMQIIDYNRIYGEIDLNSNSLFTYSGDKVSEIQLQARRHDEWRRYRTNYYEYNEENMLVRDYNSWGWVMNITYEKGKGNFGIVYYLPQEEVFSKPAFQKEEGSEDEWKTGYIPGYLGRLLLKEVPGLQVKD